MAKAWTHSPTGLGNGSKLRIARLASRQCGRITTAQLLRLGINDSTIANWTRAAYLFPCLPRVYAVGQPGQSIETRMWEAVLFAGPGAMLSHASAAWWQGLILHPPNAVHVSTPRRVRPRAGIAIHDRRCLDRAVHRGIPVTDPHQTVFDLAAAGEEALVRRSLAVLDFQGTLDVRPLLAMCGQGRRGTSVLNAALEHHDPRFAQTLSTLEDDLLLMCETHDVPKPDAVNVYADGILCDAVYYKAKVIVELDGGGNHHSPAQIRRDHANDLALRAHGWLVLRYSWHQLHEQPAAVADELLRALAARAAG
jgi:uncharacterized protein DUF559